MADGLKKHLEKLGHEVLLLYDGYYWLTNMPLFKVFLSDIYKLLLNILSGKKKHILRFVDMLLFKARYYNSILEADCLIVVDNCPNAFYKDCISRVEELRQIYKGPIVNYDLHYLPNQGWYGMIKEKDSNNFGLERFDWYLPASLVMEYAIPREIPQIYSSIGFDLQSKDLFPEQSGYFAVLDFEHPGYEQERKLQIDALETLGIPYHALKGRYTRSEIRALYRKCNVFFTSVRESFSMPVIEVQLCGAMIATPYAEWLPAHFLNKDIYEEGIGRLGSNFIVYDNNKNSLVSKLKNCLHSFDAERNVLNFKKEYPFYYSINETALKDFCDKVKNNKVTKDTHTTFEKYNSYINMKERVHLL